MEGISDPTILKQLMQGRVSKPSKWALLRLPTDIGGLEIVAVNKTTTERVGSFQGNVGSIARSRKGRTYRKPNGTRVYIPGQDKEGEIIAYKV